MRMGSSARAPSGDTARSENCVDTLPAMIVAANVPSPSAWTAVL
jgi:hypothetical protein